MNGARISQYGSVSRLIPGSYGVLRVPRHHLVGMGSVSSVSPTFLTQREVADLLRLPERTLEDWRLTSQGPP